MTACTQACPYTAPHGTAYPEGSHRSRRCAQRGVRTVCPRKRGRQITAVGETYGTDVPRQSLARQYEKERQRHDTQRRIGRDPRLRIQFDMGGMVMVATTLPAVFGLRGRLRTTIVTAAVHRLTCGTVVPHDTTAAQRNDMAAHRHRQVDDQKQCRIHPRRDPSHTVYSTSLHSARRSIHARASRSATAVSTS